MRTNDEWEQVVGQQVRAARLAAAVRQDDLARSAGVSEGALRNLELGKGSSLATLVRVARALGRTDWLESLAPPVAVSPLDALAQARRGDVLHRRVRAPRRRSS